MYPCIIIWARHVFRLAMDFELDYTTFYALDAACRVVAFIAMTL